MFSANRCSIGHYANVFKCPYFGRFVGLSQSVLAGAILLGLVGLQPAKAEESLLRQGGIAQQFWTYRQILPSSAKPGKIRLAPAAVMHRYGYRAMGALLARQHEVLQENDQERADVNQILPNDGVYLYGQRPLPDQLATAYLVFEVSAGNLVGAFYMPSSSFDCIQGQIQDTQLALTVTDSYSQETYEYALAIERDTQVAGVEGAATMTLDGYYQIQQVSSNDLRILETCQSAYDEAI